MAQKKLTFTARVNTMTVFFKFDLSDLMKKKGSSDSDFKMSLFK